MARLASTKFGGDPHAQGWAAVEVAKLGLSQAVTVDIIDKVYEVGRTCAKGFKENMRIHFDSVLPKWNYRAIPATP